MEALIPLIVGLLQHSVPLIATYAPATAEAVKIITAIAPVVAKSYTTLKPIVMRSIATIKAGKGVTPAQIAELEAAEAILDADFDKAAAAALAEDEAAAGKSAGG